MDKDVTIRLAEIAEIAAELAAAAHTTDKLEDAAVKILADIIRDRRQAKLKS